MNPDENGVRPPRQRWRAVLPLAVILIAACCIRVGVAFLSKASWYNTDTQIYLDMADGILAHRPIAATPNGYPLLIAALKSVFGPAWLPGILIAVNVAASTGIVFLCYRIGSAVASEREGWWAAALAAVWPNQINYMRQILSETPATFLLALGIWMLVKRRAGWGGVFLSLAALVRSTLAPVVGLAFVWMLLCEKDRRKMLWYAAGTAAVFAFNLALIKCQVIAPSSNAGSNLLIAVQSTSTEGIRFDTDAFTPDQKAHPLRTYLSFARDFPGAFVKQRLSSLWELWGPWPEPGDAHNPRGRLTRAIIGLRCLLFVLALAELGRAYRSAHRWLIAIPILVITCVHTAYFSTPRFSYSAEPFVMILSALFLAHLGRLGVQRIRRGRPYASPVIDR